MQIEERQASSKRQANIVDGEAGWRRESDSNRRVMVLQTIPLGHLGIAPLFDYASCSGFGHRIWA
jgi:hypothetical protein